MPVLQGAHFSIPVPDKAVDHSVYCITLPEYGDMPPSMTIRETVVEEQLVDLVRQLTEMTEAVSVTTENCEAGKITMGERYAWQYAVQVLEWGPANARIRQRNMLIHIPHQERLFSFTTTDLAENKAVSEPVFNNMLRQFNYLEDSNCGRQRDAA